ncbi:MAG: queuosine precursor transporter, partial [Myxococcales bacterium]|nr:queuosine precursor transporter [Myxococcales bacterium]
MYVALLAAYLVGGMADIWMFGWLKRRTGGRMVWLRATGSTVASQLVDSLVVTWLAFSVGRTPGVSRAVRALLAPEVLVSL